MSQTVSVVLVAVGGYGNTYVGALLDREDPGAHRIAGVVDPYFERCARLTELKARNVPFYDTLSEFYAEHDADLAIVSSPINLHCPHTCEALANGANVLCEKPLGATIQEAERMIAARDQADKFVAIGYQWSFSEAIQSLKRDVIRGRFGKPLRLKTLVAWPRNRAYYSRNNWAGARDDGRGGWVLDSPVNNATAHYLHNMFYVLGDRTDRSARPARVTGELYRANDITNFDTGVARIVTEDGVEMLYAASHAVSGRRGPEFVYEFEDGVVRLGDASPEIEARYGGGWLKSYGNPNQEGNTKLWDAIRAARGEGEIVCGPEAASSQTLAVNGMQDSTPDIVEFPPEFIKTSGEGSARITCVEGLEDVLAQCFEQNRLPSELGVPWACAGQEIDLTDYPGFPSRPSG